MRNTGLDGATRLNIGADTVGGTARSRDAGWSAAKLRGSFIAFAMRTKMRAMLQRGSDKTLMFVESEVWSGFRPCSCRHDTCTPTHS